MNAIKQVKDQEKINELSKLGVISEITNTNVSKLKSERESFVAVQTIENQNVRKTKEIELVQIVSETSKRTSENSANANANATNYRTETSNLRAVTWGNIGHEQETQTLANAIIKTELLRIENEAQIKRILAEAERAANVTVAEAEKYAYLNRTMH